MPYTGITATNDEITSLLIKAYHLLGELNGISKYLSDFHLYCNLLMKYESVLSCRLDGFDISFTDIFCFNTKGSVGTKNVETYIEAMQTGIAAIAEGGISLKTARDIHKILILNECADEAGLFREEQLFTLPKIFSDGAPVYNPPNPEDMRDAIADFEKYLSAECSYDILVKTALVYYQFITIQPFMTGNGRIARLLSLLFMVKNGVLSQPLLCLSYFLSVNDGEYLSVINSVRSYGGYEPWIKFFLRTIIIAAEKTTDMLIKLSDLRLAGHTKILSLEKSSAAVNGVYEYTWKEPFVEVRNVVKELDLSYNTIAKAVKTLTDLGILEQVEDQKRYRRYCNKKMLEIFTIF